MFRVAEPPCWGMEGLPLFPIEWKASIPPVPLPVERRRVKRATFAPLLEQFCESGWFGKAKWTEPPATVASQAAEELLSTGVDLDFLDQPALYGRIESVHEVLALPFLVSTWRAIDQLDLGNAEILSLVNDSTFLELYQRLGTMQSALDVTMTTRSWTSLSRAGRLLTSIPLRPSNIDDAFLLARRRHVLQAGFVDTGKEADAMWFEMLGGRAGLARSGELTLEAAGAIGHITRERVRQVQSQFNLDHQLFRRWPGSPELNRLEEVFERSRNARDSSVQLDLDRAVGESPSLSPDVALRLLAVFGRCTETEMIGGRVRPVGAAEFAGGLTAKEVVTTLWEVTGNTGFIRESDAMAKLAATFSEIPPDELRAMLLEASSLNGLPLNYLVLRRQKGVLAENVGRTMLQVAGELPIQSVRKGIERRSRYRRTAPPPPISVLRAYYEMHPEFEVVGDLVRLCHPRPANLSKTIEWVVDTIRSTGLNVMSRTVLFDEARSAGINQTSVSVYCLLHELLVPAGRGCVSVVGDDFGPDQLDLAVRFADSIRLQTTISTRSLPGNGVRLVVFVGHDFRDSGSLSAARDLLRRVGDRTLRIIVGGEQRGNSGVSSDTWLYGFASALAALDIIPGDAITIDLDFHTLTATVSPFDDDSGD